MRLQLFPEGGPGEALIVLHPWLLTHPFRFVPFMRCIGGLSNLGYERICFFELFDGWTPVARLLVLGSVGLELKAVFLSTLDRLGVDPKTLLLCWQSTFGHMTTCIATSSGL